QSLNHNCPILRNMKQHWSAQIVAVEAQCRAVASAASRLQGLDALLRCGRDASEQTGAAPALVQGPQVARPVPRASGPPDLSQRLGAGLEVERRRPAAPAAVRRSGRRAAAVLLPRRGAARAKA